MLVMVRRVPVVALAAVFVALGLIACSAQEQAPTLTEDAFKILLSDDEINTALKADKPLVTGYRDLKLMSETEYPEPIAGLDSGFSSSFLFEAGQTGVTLGVLDFSSRALAHKHFEGIMTETVGLRVMDPPIGDRSGEVAVNWGGIASAVVFEIGDKTVSLHSSYGGVDKPLADLDGLKSLARIVEAKLR